MAKLNLNTIKSPSSVTSKKRIGRGWASKGKYSGRGVKGQKARAGASGSKKRGLRTLMLATPKKRGFTSPAKSAPVVNLHVLEATFEDGAIISPKTLNDKKLISSIRYGAKILGVGELKKKFTVKECTVSKTAKAKIEAAGGNVS